SLHPQHGFGVSRKSPSRHLPIATHHGQRRLTHTLHTGSMLAVYHYGKGVRLGAHIMGNAAYHSSMPEAGANVAEIGSIKKRQA
ncbi:hypothetical protein ACXWRX_09290, partial [Streptococcus pyogenes]